MTSRLRYVAPGVLSLLRASVKENLARYRGEGFADLAGDGRWGLALEVEFDEGALESLVDAPDEYEASWLVGNALRAVSPAMANEEMLWVRLSHVEGFEYARKRWIREDAESDVVAKSVHTHFFAPSQTGVRDDHAIARLWWNYRIACYCLPEDPALALRQILRSADTRLNFVERFWISSRRPLAAALIRRMTSDGWLSEAETNFRDFMKAVNRLGSGVVFEALDGNALDAFVARCVEAAREGSKA